MSPLLIDGSYAASVAAPAALLGTPQLPDTRPVAAAGPRTHNRLGGTT